jgi:hypothetical protein
MFANRVGAKLMINWAAWQAPFFRLLLKFERFLDLNVIWRRQHNLEISGGIYSSLIKNKLKIVSNIRKFRMDQLQRHI